MTIKIQRIPPFATLGQNINQKNFFKIKLKCTARFQLDRICDHSVERFSRIKLAMLLFTQDKKLKI